MIGHYIIVIRSSAFALSDPVSPFRFIYNKLHFPLLHELFVWIIDMDSIELSLSESIMNLNSNKLELTWEYC